MSKEGINEIAITNVRFFPIVREYASKIGLVDTINAMVDSQMETDVGLAVLMLVIDTLSYRKPLYRMAHFYNAHDLEFILGKPMDPRCLREHNLGRILDKLYEAGTQRLFLALSQNAISAFDVDTSAVHFDTTSVSVYGDQYPYEEGSDPIITYGYSKDHRPDLRQFLISLLCTDRKIPVMGVVRNGNASDTNLNNEALTLVSKYLAKHGIAPGASVYIADSAMVTRDNLKVIEENNVKFISRLPARYKECNRVIKEAVSADKSEWIDIGTIAQTNPTEKRPLASYSAFESTVTLYDTTYRALVVHSTAHDKRRHKRIERIIDKDRKRLEQAYKDTCSNAFYCLKDAQKAADELLAKTSDLHKVSVSISEIQKFKRGRPPKDKPRQPTSIMYKVNIEIKEKAQTVEALRQEAGCFVLFTNLTSEKEKDSFDVETILRLYKDQHGIEQNFGFLKDPAIINSIFLKKPERIEVLGLIMLIALLIWRLMERQMRLFIDNNDTQLPGWPGRQTTKPTSFMMTTKFEHIMVVKMGNTVQLAKPLDEIQLAYLKALEVSPDIFTPS